MDDDRSMRVVKGSLGQSLGESEGEGHAATPVFPFQTTEAMVGVVDGNECLQCHSVKIQKISGRELHLEVMLVQGKNRETRRLFKPLGHQVTRQAHSIRLLQT